MNLCSILHVLKKMEEGKWWLVVVLLGDLQR